MTAADVHPELADRLIETYCDWRRQCREVHAAYARLSTAPLAERALAFAAYEAALDQEESASEEYEQQIRRVVEAASTVAAAATIEHAMRGNR